MIQKRFREVPGYRAAYQAERDLLYEAMVVREPRRRELLARALTMIRERRNRYFVGPDSVYAELEDLFLALEGAAVWAHHALHLREPELVSFVRTSREPAWTQDEGYALFVLLDGFVPDWRDRIFADDPASPVALLEEALAE